MYLTILQPLSSGPRVVAVFDCARGRFLSNRFITCPADIDHFNLYGYRSAHPDLLNAKLPRNRQGEILSASRPVRLCGTELTEQIWPKRKADGRGKAETSRKNLQPIRIREIRFQRPRVVTDETIAKAINMKAAGASWAQIGAALGHDPEAIRTAVRRGTGRWRGSSAARRYSEAVA